MKTSFLYEIFNGFFNLLKYLNLVELFKYIGTRFAPSKGTTGKKIEYSRISVDIFIVIKWLFLLFLCIFNISNTVFVMIVWYLLISNLYTYFYYHTWSSAILTDEYFDTDRIKRRYLTIMLALWFSIFGFSYLYFVPYSSNFQWSTVTPNLLHSIWYSIANSFTANYSQVLPHTNFGYSISMIQLVMMFIFITIIVSVSIPQSHTEEMEDPNGLS